MKVYTSNWHGRRILSRLIEAEDQSASVTQGKPSRFEVNQEDLQGGLSPLLPSSLSLSLYLSVGAAGLIRSGYAVSGGMCKRELAQVAVDGAKVLARICSSPECNELERSATALRYDHRRLLPERSLDLS